jgi:rhodanese-related sulfurtransferase
MNVRARLAAIVLASSWLAGCGLSVVPDRYYVIDGQHARSVAPAADRIVDLRPPDDYAAGHVPGAVSIPLSQLWVRADELPTRYDSVLLVYDDEPSRAERAAARLKDEGYFRVYVIEGGLRAWRDAGGEITREPPSPPVYRRGLETWGEAL